METGTEIILQRMKDCPEEFPNEGEFHNKWGRLIQDARNFLPTADVEALDTAYKQLLVDRFNERVLKTLAGEEPKLESIIYKTTDSRALLGGAVHRQQQMNAEMEEYKAKAAMQNQALSGSSYPYEQSALQNSKSWWNR